MRNLVLKLPILGKSRADLKFSALHQKFTAVCRKIATSFPVYTFLTHNAADYWSSINISSSFDVK